MALQQIRVPCLRIIECGGRSRALEVRFLIRLHDWELELVEPFMSGIIESAALKGRKDKLMQKPSKIECFFVLGSSNGSFPWWVVGIVEFSL